MKRLALVVALACAALVTLRGQTVPPWAITYTRPVTLAHPRSYDYVPSVLWNQDLGAWQAYWCGYNMEAGGDAIYYAASADRVTWSTPQMVMPRGAYGFDQSHACDPSVLYRPGGEWGRAGWAYVMYYNGADTADHNTVGAALSMDGVQWVKFGQVIDCPETVGGYGCGQLSVVQTPDGVFSASMVHLGTASASTRWMQSFDGFHWWTQSPEWSVCPGCAAGVDLVYDEATSAVFGVYTNGNHQVLARAATFGQPWVTLGTWATGTTWGDGFFRSAHGRVPSAQLPAHALLTMAGTPGFDYIAHDFELQELGIVQWNGVR